MSVDRCRPHILFDTHLTRCQINKTLTITVKMMINFKSFLSHMTGKFIISLFNIFANLAARSITFVKTRCSLQRVKLRWNWWLTGYRFMFFLTLPIFLKKNDINIVLISRVLLNALSFYLNKWSELNLIEKDEPLKCSY